MDSSLFSTQFQMVVYQLLFKLLEQYQGTTDAKVDDAGAQAQNSGQSVSGKFADFIQRAAERYDVDPRLVKAVIRAESGNNPNAVSPAGAMGLMQLMPGTAAGLGVTDPLDPEQNIFGGTKLLHRLLKRYDDDVSLALAAYNAGMGAVNRYGGIPPYRETQTYVKRVLGFLKSKYNWSA